MNELLTALINGRPEEEVLGILEHLDLALIDVDERIPEKTSSIPTEGTTQIAIGVASPMVARTGLTADDSGTDHQSPVSADIGTPTHSEPVSMSLQSTSRSHPFISNMSPFKKAFLTRSTARRRHQQIAQLPPISEVSVNGSSDVIEEMSVGSVAQRLSFASPTKDAAGPQASLRDQRTLQTPIIPLTAERKTRDELTRTPKPLMFSAASVISESRDITFEVLLQDGDLIGGTALHVAVARSLPKVVAKLLEKGALANALTKDNLPPLYYALHMFFVDSKSLARDRRDIVSHLLRFGADLAISCSDGEFTNTTLLDITFQYREMQDYRARYPFLGGAIHTHFNSLIQESSTASQDKIQLFYPQFIKILKAKHFLLEERTQYSLINKVITFCKKMAKERKRWERLQLAANITSALLGFFSIWHYIKSWFNARMKLPKRDLLPLSLSSLTTHYAGVFSTMGVGTALTFLYGGFKARQCVPPKTWVENAYTDIQNEQTNAQRQTETGIQLQTAKARLQRQ